MLRETIGSQGESVRHRQLCVFSDRLARWSTPGSRVRVSFSCATTAPSGLTGKFIGDVERGEKANSLAHLALRVPLAAMRQGL